MNRVHQKEMQDKLLAACQDGDLEAASGALFEGAKPTPGFPGTPSPLMYAADYGNIELVQLLLDAGADFSYRDDTGSTALECAAVVGNENIANLLLKLGASDEPNKQGVRPSEYADHHGHISVAKTIRENSSTTGQKW